MKRFHEIDVVCAVADALHESGEPIRLLFWESSDSRILEAIGKVAPIVTPVVLVPATSRETSRDLPNNVDVVDHKTAKVQAAFDTQRELAPCELAALLVKSGAADAAVGGAITTSADLFRSGIRFLGLREGCRTISTAGIVEPRFPLAHNHRLIFADVGTVTEPTVEQLVDIALSTATTWRSLFEEEAILGFLSSSTQGSAKVPRQDAVAKATALLFGLAPTLRNLGEVQFDAAIVPRIGTAKGLPGDIAGRANVLIFPDLNSANIGYKIAEHIGAANVVAVTQGFARPFYDLSRGASVQAIVATAILAAYEATRLTTASRHLRR